MLLLGVLLLILGLVLGAPILWTIGVILVIVGAVLFIASAADRPWGRRWY